MNTQTLSKQSGFGRHLRLLRDKRKLSQLALSTLAGTTSRHISFIETGRSRPGRDVILRIANAMQLPAREINLLLGLAGLKPERAELDFDDDQIGPYRAAIEAVLEKHDPYPGCAMNAAGDVLLANDGYKAFVPNALSGTPEERVETFFDPNGEAPNLLENWEEVAFGLLDRQRAELATNFNPRLDAMVSRMTELLQDVERPKSKSGQDDIVLSPILIAGDKRISTFSTFMKFSHAHEVTLSEIRVELTFPADEPSQEFFENLQKT